MITSTFKIPKLSMSQRATRSSILLILSFGVLLGLGGGSRVLGQAQYQSANSPQKNRVLLLKVGTPVVLRLTGKVSADLKKPQSAFLVTAEGDCTAKALKGGRHASIPSIRFTATLYT
ncbi:MAG TPA: hypothetical protein VKN18_31695 [Blastocatellia bacterium]|nr:hypothetical protein [Blastocatellia bacterium]